MFVFVQEVSAQYWPDDKAEYGKLTVTTKQEKVICDSLCTRVFDVCRTESIVAVSNKHDIVTVRGRAALEGRIQTWIERFVLAQNYCPMGLYLCFKSLSIYSLFAIHTHTATISFMCMCRHELCPDVLYTHLNIPPACSRSCDRDSVSREWLVY